MRETFEGGRRCVGIEMSKRSKIGRSARNQKNARYKNSNRRFRNKLKRVKKSCGEEFAVEWERKYGPRAER